MEYGYIGISRKIADNWIYPINQARRFTEFEAWIEIIRKANFVCVEKEIQGKVMIVPRGYFDTTVKQLSLIFQWDVRTTEKFLKKLESQKMIKRYKTSKSLKACTILKVKNYNDYQAEVCEVCNSKYKSRCNLNCKKTNTIKQTKETKKEKITKNIYGEYNNVRLTDAEYARFIEEYGEANTKIIINFLSAYRKDKGYKNKDDNLAIRRWVINACMEKKLIQKSYDENYGAF